MNQSKPNLRYQQSKPLAIVNLGDGLTITINQNDDISRLVKQFCIENDIDALNVAAIVSAIEEQIQVKKQSKLIAPTFGGVQDLMVESFGQQPIQDFTYKQKQGSYQSDLLSKQTTNQSSLSDKNDQRISQYENWQKLINNQASTTRLATNKTEKSPLSHTSKKGIFDRLYNAGVEHYKQIENQHKLNTQQRQQWELQQATFKPNISTKSKQIMGNRPNTPKISSKKQSMPEQNFTFKPMLSPNTERIMQKSKSRSNTPIHDKLYTEGIQIKELKQQWAQKVFQKEHTFKPQTRSKSPQGPLNQNQQQDLIKRLVQVPSKKKQSQLETFFDKNTGKKLFSPTIHKDQFFKEVSRKIDDEDIQIKKCLTEKHNFASRQGTSPEPQIMTPRGSNVNEFERAVQIIFNDLDGDKDGTISSTRLDLSKVDALVLELIAEILYEMEAENAILHLQDFQYRCANKGLQQELIKQTALPKPSAQMKKLFH